MIKLIWICITLLVGGSIWAQSEDAHVEASWELRKDDKAIKVYTRSYPNCKFDEYRVEMTIPATVDQFYALMRDYDNYLNVFPALNEMENVVDSDTLYINHVEINAPFPARNRQAFMVNEIDRMKDRVRINLSCSSDHDWDEDLVRVNFCKGFWEAKQITADSMHVVNQFVADPNGQVPAFIVNMFVARVPFKTFEQLREEIQHKRYRQ